MSSSGTKRSRSAGGAATYDPKRVAIAISARNRAKWPYSNYGTAHYLRGSADSVNMFGPTFKTADAAQKALRKSTGFVGRGRYSVGSFVKDMRTLGLNKYSNALGDIALGSARELANAGTRSLIGGFTGRGAYGSNRLANANTNDLFSSSDTDDIIIGHSEFLQTITPTSSDFETQFSCVLNPGLSSFAPMLAQIAQYYEEYEMLQLIFEFKSTVVDGNDNAAGTVMMATQYNPTNPLFTTDVALDNYSHSCSSKVTENLLHGVECMERATGQARFEYVRTGPVPTGQDPKTYDLAVFQLSTVGAFAGLQLGRLYVHYKVRLSKLKLVPVVPTPGLVYATRRSTGSSITTAALFGDSGSEQFYRCNAVTNIVIESNNIKFPVDCPAGVYQITINLDLPSASAVSKALPTFTNCFAVQDAEPPASNTVLFAPGNSQSAIAHMYNIWVSIPGGLLSTVLFAWTLPAGGASGECLVTVTQVSQNVELPNSAV